MQSTVMLAVMTVALQFAPVMQWSGWAIAALFIGFYIKLRLSDPFRQLERAMEKIRELTHSNEELTQLNGQLVQRNEQLSTDIKNIHAECNELRSNFKLLKIAFDKNGETIARLADDLKTERELRDQQYMQWMKEKGQRGDL